ncbi:MAG: class I SAM-dependent methyltransferase [Anaerolineae bacterium]|nr:class I SAM-dependent methyltransferase [Anaerolineae bacterium]
MVSPRHRNLLARLYLWAAERLYNELAWAYDLVSWLVSLGHWAEWRRAALEHINGRRVLEIGFGTGELLLEAASLGLEIYGLERSAAMHRVAARKLARRGIRVPRVRALAQAMPFASGCFDTIISTFPAPYILDPATAREVARLLRPPGPTESTGGRFIIVGLWVEVQHPLLRWLVRLVFGGAGDGNSEQRALAFYEHLAPCTSFQMRVVAAGGKQVSLPTLVLDKQAAGSSLRLP